MIERAKVQLRIARLATGNGPWVWCVWRNGNITAYLLPVSRFRFPAQVIEELKTNPEEWNINKQYNARLRTTTVTMVAGC